MNTVSFRLTPGIYDQAMRYFKERRPITILGADFLINRVTLVSGRIELGLQELIGAMPPILTTGGAQ